MFRRLLITCAAAMITLSLNSVANADPIIVGNETGNQATANITSFSLSNNTFTFTIQNTSPFDARITAIGFDLVPGDFTSNNSSGLNGFTGTVVSQPPGADFEFTDGSLGNVPQFNNAVLDFGFTTGNSGNFNGGSPNQGLAPGQSATFSVTGPFGNLSAEQIANSIFVRFQRVGPNGEGSDVGRPVPGPGTGPGPEPIPEPATMLLLGTGLAGVAAKVRKRRKAASTEDAA